MRVLTDIFVVESPSDAAGSKKAAVLPLFGFCPLQAPAIAFNADSSRVRASADM